MTDDPIFALLDEVMEAMEASIECRPVTKENLQRAKELLAAVENPSLLTSKTGECDKAVQRVKYSS
jgi:hypothetical protein